MISQPDPSTVARFAAAMEQAEPDASARIGVAVSGGPDSLALLLLAAAARPGRIAAATVDHGLRPEGRAEAEAVAASCRSLGVEHETLRPAWTKAPAANIQAAARAARYDALARWASAQGLALVLTGHHQDDQAETLLMRLARGAGLAGLAGVRPRQALANGLVLARPLLGWRKAELEAIVAAAGLEPALDPTNRDERFDRSRARALLAATGWLGAERVAASAAHLGEAEEALAWAAARLFAERASGDPAQGLTIRCADLPRELQRRLLLHALAAFGVDGPPGPKLSALLDSLRAGRQAMLGDVLARGGETWRLSHAPPRRHCD